MPTVDQIRRKVREVLAAVGKKPMTAARELGIDRYYLNDFVTGKKRSLRLEVAIAFSEKYGVPLAELTPTPAPAAIRRGAKPHFYIAEHMATRGWDDEDLARRMDVDASTIARWRSSPQEWQIPAFLHAFGMEEVAELARPPSSSKKPLSARSMRRKA